MSLKSLPKVKALAKEECHYYCYENTSCLKNDRMCIFYCPTDGEDVLLRCLYFEQCVLPIKPVVENQYKAERNLSGAKGLEKCANPKCNKLFLPSSGHQKYCGECQKDVQKQQSKRRMQKMRKTT